MTAPEADQCPACGCPTTCPEGLIEERDHIGHLLSRTVNERDQARAEVARLRAGQDVLARMRDGYADRAEAAETREAALRAGIEGHEKRCTLPDDALFALLDGEVRPGRAVHSTEWGVRLDDLGSTDTYDTEAAARAALADGGDLVRIDTVITTIDGEVRP